MELSLKFLKGRSSVGWIFPYGEVEFLEENIDTNLVEDIIELCSEYEADDYFGTEGLILK